MRRWFLVLAVLLTVSCARPRPSTEAPAASSGPRTISIIATTDVHGHVESLPWFSGHVRNVREARRDDGGGVLLLDAGDMWQGTLESNLGEGAAVVRAYNALRYDAVTIGNHEFDFGPSGANTVPRTPNDNPTGNIEQRARQAKFPFLAANLLTRSGAPWTPPNVTPSKILTIAGVRVGLLGVTTISTPTSTDPRNLVRLTVAPLKDVVEREARRLRESGATIVVVLAHAGGSCDVFTDPDDLSSCRTQGEVFQLARALAPGLVDVITAGHAHFGIAHRVNGIAVVEAYEQGRAFSRVDLSVDVAGRPTDVRIHPPRYLCDGVRMRDVGSWSPKACAPTPYEGQPVRFDAHVVSVLRQDIQAAQRKREQPLGVDAPRAYPHSNRDESPASHFVVDLLRASRPGTDLAIYNATGTRASLAEGPITYGDVYALLPFDSVIATGTIPAARVADAILRGVTRGPIPIVSGIEADVTCDGGTPHVALSRAGQPVSPETMVSIVTSEFLSSGGAGYFPEMEGSFALRLDTPMREAIVSVVKQEEDAIRTGRVGGQDPAHKRIRTPGGSFPVRCEARPVASQTP
jgi:2',3'-cyclic-nucleotide 2'-phosphodiesterase (5'-nucleotidase family)